MADSLVPTKVFSGSLLTFSAILIRSSTVTPGRRGRQLQFLRLGQRAPERLNQFRRRGQLVLFDFRFLGQCPR